MRTLARIRGRARDRASRRSSPRPPPTRERARAQNRLGWEQMTAESWESAAKYFQNAIDIDPTFEIAALRTGPRQHGAQEITAAAAAYVALPRALSRAGRTGSSPIKQEAQRYRQRSASPKSTSRSARCSRARRPRPAGHAAPVAEHPPRRAREHAARQRRDDRSGRSRRGCRSRLAAPTSARARSPMPSANTRRRSTPIPAPAKRTTISRWSISKRDESPRLKPTLRNAKKSGFKVNPQLEQAIKER